MITEAQLVDLVRNRRWFGDKSRTIESAGIAWSAPVGEREGIRLSIVELGYADGERALYLLAIDESHLAEVTESSEFVAWLRDAPMASAALPLGLRWEQISDADLPGVAHETGRPLGVDQSNTSVRFGDRLLVKLNRKLSVGASPEAELAAVIAKAADRSFAPITYGALTLNGVFAQPVTIALYTAFVPNSGDAWHEMLASLNGDATAWERSIESARAIGETTGRMHLGLLSDPWRSDVSAEPISDGTLTEWEEGILAELDGLAGTLKSGTPSTDESVSLLLPLLSGALPALRDQIRGIRALAGTYRMRIHGDYHLGQVLRTIDDRYVVVDFDGEPQRTLDERRRKYSALRDVAGMLRSFAYARGTAERSMPDRSAADFRTWESEARRALLDGYFPVARSAQVPILPAAADDMRRALTALEIEKAIYEFGYEINNRPEWLWLPLSRLVSAT